MSNHTKLSQTERSLLARWKEEGLSNKECARRLVRHPSTIGRELKRNRFEKNLLGEIIYEPLHAQWKTEERKQRAWRAKHPLKNKDVYAFVREKLHDGWSPEQIAGRLRLLHPDDKHWQITHETIYQFIYHQDNKEDELWEYLRRKQKKRRKQKGRKVHRARIPDRVSIHQRPEAINQRLEFGHWEGDSLIGRRRQNGLHTAYERLTSFTRFEKMVSLKARASYQAQARIYDPLPEKARKSTTLDNGSEHVLHFKLKKRLGIQTYFADPYSAWQRGGNENANLWIRYYFPKGTDFSKITDEELKDVEWELNNRPRKRLGFKTPMEVFAEHLKGCNR